MITRFRVEATGKTREEVQDELLKAVGNIAKALRAVNNANGHWECTDDVIHMQHPVSFPQRHAENGVYKGRIVMTYRGWHDEQE